MDFPSGQAPGEASAEGRRAIEIGAAAISDLRTAKHAAGLSYTVLHTDGQVRHAHPDGTIRVSRDPGSEVVG